MYTHDGINHQSTLYTMIFSHQESTAGPFTTSPGTTGYHRVPPGTMATLELVPKSVPTSDFFGALPTPVRPSCQTWNTHDAIIGYPRRMQILGLIIHTINYH